MAGVGIIELLLCVGFVGVLGLAGIVAFFIMNKDKDKH